MRIVDILNEESISSNMENWTNECAKFRSWYCKLGTQEINEIEMAKAYLKIEPVVKKKHNEDIFKYFK